MLLNGKNPEDWTLDDIDTLVGNFDFKENEYIDYKVNFAFLEVSEKKIKKQKKDEMRHDICSFANAYGGVIVFGLDEDNGVVKSVVGVDIPKGDVDAFELSLRDAISKIEPVVPKYSLYFLPMRENKYVVILEVYEGYYKPYVNKDDHLFKFYMRRGNGKVSMNYEEVRNMYNQGVILSNQINEFRDKRVQLTLAKEGSSSLMKSNQYALIHFIPESAFSTVSIKQTISNWRKDGNNYRRIFNNSIEGMVRPNVDGIVYENTMYADQDTKYLQLYANGIIENFLGIKVGNRRDINKDSIRLGLLITDLKNLYTEALSYYESLNYKGKIYLGFCVLNCKGLCSDYDFDRDYIGIIDRDKIKSMAYEISLNDDNSDLNIALQNVLEDLCYSLGIMNLKKHI